MILFEPKDIANALYRRRREGVIVPYEPLVTTGWTPSEHDCHDNCDRYVRENPDFKLVRGWMVFDLTSIHAPFGLPAFCRFNAHSVIQDADGRLIDITPSGASQRYPFIKQEGPEGEFEAMLAAGLVSVDHNGS